MQQRPIPASGCSNASESLQTPRNGISAFAAPVTARGMLGSECVEHLVDRLQRIGVLRLFVVTPTRDAREPDRDTDLCRVEGWIASNANSKTSSGFHGADRAECLERVVADPAIDLAYLGVGQA